MKRTLLSFIGMAQLTVATAQFETRAGETGSTAIYKDSSVFTQWAKACQLSRGYMNIANPSAGFANVGTAEGCIGKSGNGVASLGDGGSAVLTFDLPIANGPGFDFAVFENGFKDVSLTSFDFLEFAFVEVSSDGLSYFRFPSEYIGPPDTQIGEGQATDTRFYHNFAGKYVAGYGTPFDLEELKNEEGLDVNNITHVKIVDVVGNIADQYATYDSKGRKVSDPWPTEFGSSGFDLDAVGVINVANALSIEKEAMPFGTQIYPNPATEAVHLISETELKVELKDLTGKKLKAQHIVLSGSLDLTDLSPGVYVLDIEANQSRFSKKIIIK